MMLALGQLARDSKRHEMVGTERYRSGGPRAPRKVELKQRTLELPRGSRGNTARANVSRLVPSDAACGDA